MRINVLLFAFFFLCQLVNANPVDELLERIDRGASHKIKTVKVSSGRDFFELDQEGARVVVRGNTWVNIATGVNWYLKYYAGIHISWNNMHPRIPATLPRVSSR